MSKGMKFKEYEPFIRAVLESHNEAIKLLAGQVVYLQRQIQAIYAVLMANGLVDPNMFVQLPGESKQEPESPLSNIWTDALDDINRSNDLDGNDEENGT